MTRSLQSNGVADRKYEHEHETIRRAWYEDKMVDLVDSISLFAGINTSEQKERFIRDYNNYGYLRARKKYSLKRGEEYLLYRKYCLELNMTAYKMKRFTKWTRDLKREFLLDSVILPVEIMADKYNLKITTIFSYMAKFTKEVGHVEE